MNPAGELLRSLKGFDDELLRAIDGFKLSTIEMATKEICSLWVDSTASLACILRAEPTWNPYSPTPKELILATWDYLDDSQIKGRSKVCYTIFSRGERDDNVDPREAIAQLCDPEQTNPIFLTSLRLSLVNKSMFRVPIKLSTTVESYDEANIQLNLTPKYSFIDLHIGSLHLFFVIYWTC